MIEINKIYNMDCLEGMKLIEDKSVDMILCDLPYGTTDCKWDKIINYEELWNEYERIISDIGSIVLFASGTFTFNLISTNRKLLKYKYVWVKNNCTNFVHAKNKPMTKHEDILVFSKAPMGHKSQLKHKRMVYNPQGLISVNKTIKSGKGKFGTVAGERPSHKSEYVQEFTNYPNDVLTGFAETSANKKLHTSEKPISLLEYLIKTYTEENAVVLDNCIGSGTTSIASINTNRNYIGFELDKNYYDIASERINNHLKLVGGTL